MRHVPCILLMEWSITTCYWDNSTGYISQCARPSDNMITTFITPRLMTFNTIPIRISQHPVAQKARGELNHGILYSIGVIC